VRVHKDGRVKVLNSDYSQFVELPSAKAGMLDGDRIVREFRGGRQYLYITENGFRQEIVVDKPTFPLEKFLAKSSGKLPAKYKESPLTATDANGEGYTYSGNVKKFGDWLDRAVYPVTIDPDFAIGNTNYGDFYINSGGAPHYNSQRNYGASVSCYPYENQAAPIMSFDLTSINGGSICTAVVLKMTRLNTNVNSRLFIIYSIASGNSGWIEGTKAGQTAGSGEPCWNAKEADGSGGVTTAWAGSAGMSTAGTDYETTVLMKRYITSEDKQYGQISFEFNAAGVARIEDWFGSPNTNYGFILRPITYGDTILALSEHTTASYRPVLSVTYSAGGIPKHFLHYARQRGN
jgi:hypothetical protein